MFEEAKESSRDHATAKTSGLSVVAQRSAASSKPPRLKPWDEI